MLKELKQLQASAELTELPIGATETVPTHPQIRRVERSVAEYFVYLLLLTTIRQLVSTNGLAEKIANGETDESVCREELDRLGTVRNRLAIDPRIAATALFNLRRQLGIGTSEQGK